MPTTAEGYEKSHCVKRSRPPSRIDSCSSAKSRTSNSSDRFYNAVSKLCENVNYSSARSHSLPIRPTTRRKSSNMPKSNENSTTRCSEPTSRPKNCKCFITDLTKRHSETVTTNVDDSNFAVYKTPTPAPRKKTKSKHSAHKKGVVEHDYLKFSLRIMEDIIRNNLHTNRQMRSIFKNHLEANAGHLDNAKMIQQINYLQLELNVPYESDDENEFEITEVIPPINYGECSFSAKLNSDLKCECKVVRRLPFFCENAMIMNEKNETSNIEQLVQEENEILYTVQDEIVDNRFSFNPHALSPRLSSVLEKSEPTSSVENINQNLDNEYRNKDEILSETKVMTITQTETFSSVLKNIEEDSSKTSPCNISKESLLLLTSDSPNYSLNQDLVKVIESSSNDSDEKALMLTTSEQIHMHKPSSNVNDNYVLITGPVFVPKAYLNDLTSEKNKTSVPDVPDKDSFLVITKDTGVNTDLHKTKQESVSIQCVLPRVDTIDKCLNTSTTTFSIFESNNTNSLDIVSSQNILWRSDCSNRIFTEKVPDVNLDYYDLTPERDNNYKNIKADLLLGDEYEIQKKNSIFKVSPQILSEFYPDSATQTRPSDWSLTSNLPAQEKQPILDTPLREVLSSQIDFRSIDTFFKQDILRNESDKHADPNCLRKSNLKYHLNSSTDSLTIEEDEAEDRYKKRQSIKGVSLNVDTLKSKMVTNEGQINDSETEVLKKESQCSSDYEDQEEEDESNRLNTSDIMTSLPELVPQPSVLMTVKRVTKTWDKLRSKRSMDKSNSSRTFSFVDELLLNPHVLKNQKPTLNSDGEPKEENTVKDMETPGLEKSDSNQDSCCGLKTRTNKNRKLTTTHKTEQIIPIISTIDNEKHEGDNSRFSRELSTSTSSLQKGVRYKSQLTYIDQNKTNDNDVNSEDFYGSP